MYLFFYSSLKVNKYPMDDTEFWRNLKWPCAPNQDDYKIFKSHCKGQVLLLGSTELLLPLCLEAWDLAPRYDDHRIKQRDWLSLDSHWDTIIADGSFAFGKELTDQLLPLVLKNCDRFIIRSFLNPNWPTRYAVYFPRAKELTPQPLEHPINEVYTFYIWKRNEQY